MSAAMPAVGPTQQTPHQAPPRNPSVVPTNPIISPTIPPVFKIPKVF
jgi:hypothetical protein